LKRLFQTLASHWLEVSIIASSANFQELGLASYLLPNPVQHLLMPVKQLLPLLVLVQQLLVLVVAQPLQLSRVIPADTNGKRLQCRRSLLR
jgi:hypothetical protein